MRSGMGRGVDTAVAPKFGVRPPGLVELVFEGDDAAGGVEGGAVVDQGASASGEAQLISRVAAMAAGRALRLNQTGLAQAAQERLGDPEDLRGPAHAVGGVVVVVEPVGCCRGVWVHRTFPKETRAPAHTCTGAQRVFTPSTDQRVDLLFPHGGPSLAGERAGIA